jgi:hypothetical protein
VGGVLRGGFEGVGEDFFHLLVGDFPWRARPGFVGQPVQAVFDEPGPPFAHRGAGHAEAVGDLAVVRAGGAFQDDA